MDETTHFVVNPCLIYQVDASGQAELCFSNDDSSISSTMGLIAALALARIKQPFTKAQFFECARMVGHPIDDLFWLAVRAGSLVVLSEERTEGWSRTEPAEYEWTKFGWSVAKLFHQSILATQFVSGTEEGWELTGKVHSAIASSGKGPSLTRELNSKDKIALDDHPPKPNKDFFETIISRRTRRNFNASITINKSTISGICNYTARPQGMLSNPYFGDHFLRTSPSGGARHPVELYPVVLRSPDLQTGVYHYNPALHTIAKISNADDATIHMMGQRQAGTSGMPLAFIVTIRFCRNLWKYRYSKSYLFSWLDVGHFVQTLVLVCNAYGLGCFLTPALDVECAQTSLKLTNVYDECAVYLVCVG
jgi:SagB-type dehydrogenase family enzyme